MTKLKLIFPLLVSATILSCNNKKENESHTNLATFENDIHRLNFSSVNPLYPDKQILVFNKLGSKQDTSWSLSVFKLNDSSILVNLNEITPKIIAENFSINKDTLNFSSFNGYRCVLSLSYWNDLVKASGLDNYKVKNPKRREFSHGTLYSLYYHSQAIVDSEKDVDFLRKVDSLFTKTIISKINYRAAHTPSQYDEK